MKVKDVKANKPVDRIELEIVSKAEPRKFATAKGEGEVCNAAGKDDTGEIQVSLWNDQISQVKEGDKIVIEQGWCGDYKGTKQLSTGKFGKLTVL